MDINRITALILCFFLVLSGVCVYGDESQPAAGAVQNVEIQESFDINSGFYEQKLADGLEFFSSLPNGATVNDFVYFDVPMGLMNVAAERDGVSIKFENKTLFTQKGYYILKFSAVTVDGNALTGVFTFRIGDKPIGAVKTSEYLYPVVKCIANIVSDESGMYRYCLPNYKAFVTNVPEYGANVENARFIIPKNLGYSLKKDGKNISLVNNRIYSDPGSYSLRIFGSSYGNSMGYEAYYETVLDFTVGDVDLSEDIAGAISDFSSATDLSSVSAVSSYVEPFINSDTSSDINISTGTPLDNLIGSILMGDDNEETSDIPESIQEEPEILPEADIINDTLIETYFENASLFSETFSSGSAFYTNTPNDGIVGGNVYLDIPSDMSVEMSKDGTSVPFENKTYINDEGSYSLLVTVKDGEDILSARYTFRIQDGTDVSPQIEEESSDDTYDYFNEEDYSDGGDMSGSYDFDSDDVEYDIENSYDSEKMMFAFEERNSVFYLSVPDGMATNEDVTTDIPKDLKLVLKKDGEEIPIEKTISGDGHYEISLSDKKNVSFDIVSGSTNKFEKFVVPEGYTIMQAEYDAQDRYDRESDVYKKGMETYRNSMLMSSKVREMPLDGAYSFMLEPRGSRSMPALSVTIVSDRTAPEAVFEGLDENMSTKEKAVTVSCKDLEAELMLGDEVLTLKDGKAQITGSGEYTLTVSDPAGNKNEYKFILDSENVKKGLPVWLIVILVIVLIILAVIIIMVIGNIISGMSGHSKKDKDKGNADNTDDDWESGSSEDTGDDWESGSFTDDDDIWGSGNFSDKGGSYDNASDDGENTDDDDWENG